MISPIPSSSDSKTAQPATVAIIGGGPAGLMAADVISAHGIAVDLYDAMPSLGRKFLLAGIGGLNLTHAESPATFLTRYDFVGYAAAQNSIRKIVAEFDASAVRQWTHDLGIETFIGSSGRVFPTGMKAAPLLRNWLRRLRAAAVQFHVRHRWLGWNEKGEMQFQTPLGIDVKPARAVILALGGGSWARLGSDGAWVPLLQQRGVDIAPLVPANCGFDCGWSDFFSERFAGQPLKSVAIALNAAPSVNDFRRGECVITQTGIEGSLIYALSAPIRDEILRTGSCTIYLDLTPDRSRERIDSELAKPCGSHSLAKHLHGRVGIDGVKSALLREALSAEQFKNNDLLARTIKALPLKLTAPRPLDEAISTAGGVLFQSLDKNLMLKAMPGYFCAGEMLDWEAPTGGYLLTGCLASGRRAGLGVLEWLRSNN